MGTAPMGSPSTCANTFSLSAGSQIASVAFQASMPSTCAGCRSRSPAGTPDMKPAALGIGEHLEGILEKACAGGDFEWAAVVRGSADDDDRRAAFLARRLHAHLRETVRKNCRSPSAQYARTPVRFLNPRHAVDDGAVGPRSRHAEKISAARGRLPSVPFIGTAHAERDAPDSFPRESGARHGECPRECRVPWPVCWRSRREQRHGNLASGEPVDHFVDGAVAAADDRHAAALLDGKPRDVPWRIAAGGGRKFGGDSSFLQIRAACSTSGSGDAAGARWWGCRSAAHFGFRPACPCPKFSSERIV